MVVPSAEYAALVKTAREVEARAAPFRPFQAPRWKILRDREVCAFVLESAKTMVVREIIEACEARFGRKRTPAKTTLYRFLAMASNRPQSAITDALKGR